MSKEGSQKTKRQAMREKRQKQQRQKRLIIIAVIATVAAIIILALVVPAIQQANAPVGEFTKVTPYPRPNADGLAMGNPDAPVTIEVFEDFKCSACLNFHLYIEPQVVTELVETGQVYYIFRQYPFLDNNSNVKDSDNAANASMCAAEQNRFWDYKDLLFANFAGSPGEFRPNRLMAFAESLGLDTAEFENCLDGNRYQDDIDADVLRGESLGATGTPSVFVNEVIVSPGKVPSLDDIKAAVEAALNP